MPASRTFLAPHVVRAEFWQPTADGRLRCDLCPRECRIAEGQRGFCFVRQVRDGVLTLATYGRASGFCLDPIEKKPLHHFLPGSSVLSFGTAGCNLGCRFCQNWVISKSRDQERLSDVARPEEIAAAARRSGARSLAFTYNDPVIFAEFAIDCALAARELGIQAVAVTAGYIQPTARTRFFGPMHAANVDLKAFSDDFYRRQCLGRLQPVLETLSWLHRETNVWLEVTTLLIPGLNDSSHEIGRLCDWFLDHLGPDVPLHFTAFHPDFRLLHLGPTPADTLRRARRQARSAGLRFVYTGNTRDPEGQSTVCPACRTTVIGRDGYRLTDWRLDPEGRCLACGTALPGRLDPAGPGTWGNRRERIPIP